MQRRWARHGLQGLGAFWALPERAAYEGGRMGQRGSVMAAAVAMITMVMTFALAIAEVAWAHYTINTAQQAADFAAEAAARFRSHRVDDMVWKQTLVPCVDFDYRGQPCKTKWQPAGHYYRQDNLEEERLLSEWPTIFLCGVNDYVCTGDRRVLRQYVVFLPEAETAARATFFANWRDRGAAWIEPGNFAFAGVSQTGQVKVVVRLHHSPLFLSFMGEREVTISGSATVQLSPVTF